MTQKPDLVKAFVSSMPFQLPFPAPPFFAWVVGMVLVWTLLLVVPFYLTQAVVILLILLIDTGDTHIFSVTIRDLLIGLVWGTAFDASMLLLWFCLIFRWQFGWRESI